MIGLNASVPRRAASRCALRVASSTASASRGLLRSAARLAERQGLQRAERVHRDGDRPAGRAGRPTHLAECVLGLRSPLADVFKLLPVAPQPGISFHAGKSRDSDLPLWAEWQNCPHIRQ